MKTILFLAAAIVIVGCKTQSPMLLKASEPVYPDYRLEAENIYLSMYPPKPPAFVPKLAPDGFYYLVPSTNEVNPLEY